MRMVKSVSSEETENFETTVQCRYGHHIIVVGYIRRNQTPKEKNREIERRKRIALDNHMRTEH